MPQHELPDPFGDQRIKATGPAGGGTALSRVGTGFFLAVVLVLVIARAIFQS
jgi:hypothetical protein